MDIDIVQRNRDLRRRKQKGSFDAFFWVAFILLGIVVSIIYYKEASLTNSDIYLHAAVAAEFDFLDLHSITSRIAYPFWHLNFAVLYKLGVPYVLSAAIVCIVYKMIGFVLVQRIIFLSLPDLSARVATGCALVVMFITAIRIPGVNSSVYYSIGSPTVWHNPTQILAIVSSLLCLPYTIHCIKEFEQLRKEGLGKAVMLPWSKVLILSALLLFSVFCKPTFMQAFLPAAAVMFLILWIKNLKSYRYFLQMILAFLPAAIVFLVQYLYYTGVVVPYTSGVAVSFTISGLWIAVRNMLMMGAFPLIVLLITAKKTMFRDRTVILCLLIAVISVAEAAIFTETGLREDHGNFNWASMNAAFLLWVIALPRFIDAIGTHQYETLRLKQDIRKGAVLSKSLKHTRFLLRVQSAAFLVAFILLIWHIYSSVYYLYYLVSTGSVF